MSDKNRNISDINDQKTAEQQAFSEEIRRRLAEPGSGKPTLDEFKVTVYKDREKRRKKRNALVACIVAAFIVGFLSFDALVPEVGADKNPKETIQTEDGVIIEDGGWGLSEDKDNYWSTEDWQHVKDAKDIFPDLLIPNYIPTEYTFESLVIEKTESNAITALYLFSNKKDKSIEIELFMFEGGEISVDINDVKKEIDSKKGNIYLQGNDKATSKFDGGIISVYGELDEENIVRIIEELNS